MVEPTVHADSSWKRSFSKTPQLPKESENAGYSFSYGNVLKTELFENDGVTIIMWFSPWPSLPEHKFQMASDCVDGKFRNGDKLLGNFPGKFPENLEIVEFPKSEPFNRKFRKFRKESQKGTEIPGKKFLEISVYLARLSSFREIPENSITFAIGNLDGEWNQCVIREQTAAWTSFLGNNNCLNVIKSRGFW